MIYVLTGHLGSGKTLLAVRLAQEYLEQGRPVASNMTLNLEHLMPVRSRATAVKLPYIPSAEHLSALGRAVPDDQDYDESKFGLILLDEAGTWLNSRDWQDKGRRALFQWITHARKYGWDVALIIQDFEALDAQIRRAVTEIYVGCARLDRIKVPYLPLRLPRMHLAVGRYGGPNGQKYKTWIARGTDLFRAYNTREAVRQEIDFADDGSVVDARVMYSMLSAWHLVGRYRTARAPVRLWLLFVLKWLLAWPALLFDRTALRRGAVLASGRRPGRDALRSDLAQLLPGLGRPVEPSQAPRLTARRHPHDVLYPTPGFVVFPRRPAA